MSFIKAAIDIVFPPRCISCGLIVGEHGEICAKCWGGMVFASTPCCSKCGFPFEYDLGIDALCLECEGKDRLFQKARFLWKYNDISKKIIHRFKYYDHTYLAKILAKLSYHIIIKDFSDSDLIVPVPLHRYRLMSRFYNQSALLAREIARLLQNEHYCCALKKQTSTTPQAQLTKIQRQNNVKNSFAIEESLKAKIQGKNILLIDDVMTTGSTIHECCKILLKNGCKGVNVFTVARTIK